ncbi:MAG TPA: GMC family oxidoreductase [Deltaproteobacteria bacterium]|nr:GMC family oxidoreductase [Deltaproteobacteria bacterium]
MIRTGADVPEGFVERTDVCVIGSGAGGGVAAAVLAGAGREVWILEEGPHVPRERMTQREEEMYPLLYRDGGEQRTDDGGISVLQGRALGGSTVVNMADVTGIREEVWAHWRQRFGLTRYDLDALAEAEAICRGVIGANPIAPSRLNRNNARLIEGGARLGLATSTMEHNRTGCVGSGYCLVGCAYDAKRSVALTWIPRALATGHATIQTEARVERLEHERGRVIAANGQIVRVRDSAALAPFRIEADTFVIAAGSVHSPLLLAASGLGGRAVGRHLSLQPQAPVAAVFPDEIEMFRGIPQAALVDCERASAEDGLAGFRLEAVSATPGMAAVTTALDTEQLHRFMASYRRVAACLCLVPDRPTGEVRRAWSGRPRIHYRLDASTEATLLEAIETAARCWLAAGAQLVALPIPGIPPVRSVDELGQLAGARLRPAEAPLISAHPQGTCRMGPDPATSVVGLDHRIHGTDNAYVFDASVFPTTAASHTQLPVMALSWLGARALIS